MDYVPVRMMLTRATGMDENLSRALSYVANQNGRGPREQAVILLREALQRMGVLTDENREALRAAKKFDADHSGVVPLTCGLCGTVFGVINADVARRERDEGVVHFCKACMAMPEAELVARLEAMQEA